MRAKNNRKTFSLTQLKQRLQQQRTTAAQAPAPQQNKQSAPHQQPPLAKKKATSPPTTPTTAPATTQALSPEERLLFKEAMSQVAPLTTRQRRVFLGAQKSSAQTQQRARLKRAHAQGGNRPTIKPSATLTDPNFLSSALDENLEHYLNPLCGTDVLLKLRRGHWPLEASIDLHGATLEHAHRRLESFLQHCLAENYRCLRIVHGKGYGSINQQPVLRQQIRRWLTQLKPVLAYCDCPPHEGGAGAVKVLLKKNRDLS